MAKLYVFTLNFTNSLGDIGTIKSLYPSVTQILNRVRDRFGYFQLFHSKRAQFRGEVWEMYDFTRTFDRREQIDRAADEGCFDIQRFYSLLDELESKEQICFLGRIILHGTVGNAKGFAMDDFSSGVEKKIHLSPNTISTIIIKSLPRALLEKFTFQSPLTIQLVSCSAGNAINYFYLELNTLAANLVSCFIREGVFTRVQASTTSIATRLDYILRELAGNRLELQSNDTITVADSICENKYRRRGLMNALNHMRRHAKTIEDEKMLNDMADRYFKYSLAPAFISISEIIRTKKRGYQLLFTLTPDRTIMVNDVVTNRPFIDLEDQLFEVHRDCVLEYFWLGYFYQQLSKTQSNFLKYCLPASNLEILLFIRDIEQANDRAAMLAALIRIESTLMPRMTMKHYASLFGTKLLNLVTFNNSFYEECNIQKFWRIDKLRQMLADPTWNFQSFDLP